MRKDKIRAFELRRQSKSYSEIGRILGISKGTLGDWFKDQEWSKKIRDKLGRAQSLAYPKKLAAIMRANKARWDKWHRECQEEGILEFSDLKKDPLFITGIMLYWGEGDKKIENCKVRLANSDPNIIKLFYLFLLGPSQIPREKISISLLLYPDLIDSVQKQFWSKSTGVPIEQFKKSIYIKGRHPTRRLSYGVCNIIVHSRKLKEKIIIWTKLYQEHLISKYGHLA